MVFSLQWQLWFALCDMTCPVVHTCVALIRLSCQSEVRKESKEDQKETDSSFPVLCALADTFVWEREKNQFALFLWCLKALTNLGCCYKCKLPYVWCYSSVIQFNSVSCFTFPLNMNFLSTERKFIWLQLQLWWWMHLKKKNSNWFEFVYSYQTGVIFMTNMIDQSQSCLSILLHCLEYKWIDLCNVTSPCVYR